MLGTRLHLERAREECGFEGGEDFLVLDVGALEHAAGPAFERGHFLFGLAVLVPGEHPDEKRLQFIVVADLVHEFRAFDLGRFPVDEQGVERKIVKNFQTLRCRPTPFRRRTRSFPTHGASGGWRNHRR